MRGRSGGKGGELENGVWGVLGWGWEKLVEKEVNKMQRRSRKRGKHWKGRRGEKSTSVPKRKEGNPFGGTEGPLPKNEIRKEKERKEEEKGK